MKNSIIGQNGSVGERFWLCRPTMLWFLEYRKLGKRLAELGISHRLSAPYSHQQMGHVKRRHRHLINTKVAMLNQTSLLANLWDFGVLLLLFIQPKSNVASCRQFSPFEQLLDRALEYKKLRVFWSRCYPCLRPYRSNKLDVKSKLCIFIGYTLSQDCYLCLEPTSRRIFASREVFFNELDFSLNSQVGRDLSCNKSGNYDQFGNPVGVIPNLVNTDSQHNCEVFEISGQVPQAPDLVHSGSRFKVTRC